MTDPQFYAIPDEPDHVLTVRDNNGDLWVRLNADELGHRTGGRDWLGRTHDPRRHWFSVTTAAEYDALLGGEEPDTTANSEQIIAGHGTTWDGLLTLHGPLRDTTGEDEVTIVSR